jgi:hypothetical protein
MRRIVRPAATTGGAQHSLQVKEIDPADFA